jgi:hypothetical protein
VGWTDGQRKTTKEKVNEEQTKRHSSGLVSGNTKKKANKRTTDWKTFFLASF